MEKTIEEMIAEAKAEENAFVEKKDNREISIPLAEYVYLKQKEIDFDRLLEAILGNARLNYDKSGVMIEDKENIFSVIKTLFSNVYDYIYKFYEQQYLLRKDRSCLLTYEKLAVICAAGGFLRILEEWLKRPELLYLTDPEIANLEVDLLPDVLKCVCLQNN
jgi:hypothetical protein